jgi:hypothetical protein
VLQAGLQNRAEKRSAAIAGPTHFCFCVTRSTLPLASRTSARARQTPRPALPRPPPARRIAATVFNLYAATPRGTFGPARHSRAALSASAARAFPPSTPSRGQGQGGRAPGAAVARGALAAAPRARGGHFAAVLLFADTERAERWLR